MQSQDRVGQRVGNTGIGEGRPEHAQGDFYILGSRDDEAADQGASSVPTLPRVERFSALGPTVGNMVLARCSGMALKAVLQ